MRQQMLRGLPPVHPRGDADRRHRRVEPADGHDRHPRAARREHRRHADRPHERRARRHRPRGGRPARLLRGRLLARRTASSTAASARSRSRSRGPASPSRPAAATSRCPPGEGTVTFPYEVRAAEGAARRRAAARPADPRRAAFRFGPEAGGQRYTVVLELPLDAIQFEKDKDPAVRARPLLLHGRCCGRPGAAVAEKFSQDAPALAAAQPARRAEAGQRRLHALVHAARGPLPPRDGGDGPADGPHHASSRAACSCPRRARGRAEQPRRGEADGAGARRARSHRTTRSAPATRASSRGSPRRSSTPARTSGLFFVAYVPAGLAARRRSRSSSSATGTSWAAPSPRCRRPDAQGRVPYVVSVPAARFAPGRYEVRAELRSGRDRAWERCSFRLASAASPRRPSRVPRLEPSRAGRYPEFPMMRLDLPQPAPFARRPRPPPPREPVPSAAARRPPQPAAAGRRQPGAERSRPRSSSSPSTPSWPTARASRYAA